MIRSICVYCASSNQVSPVFFEAARELGKTIAAKGQTLVYGGAKVGLMEAMASAALAGGGKVVGIIPQTIFDRGLGHDAVSKLHVTRDLRERKSMMELQADAFIAMPGGIGTLEEVVEVLTLKQLGLHAKPIVLLNIANHYAPLLEYFDHLIASHFAREETSQLYHVAECVADAFAYLESYRADAIPTKWLS